MTIRRLHSDAAAPVRAPYTPAVAARGSFVFLSGQGPFTVDGALVDSSFRAQMLQTLSNLKALVEEAGTTLSDVVRVGVYLKDMSTNFEEMNEIYGEFFPHPLPARTTIPVDLPRFDIEIDAIVCLDSDSPIFS